MSKNLDKTVRLQSENRKGWIEEVRERLQRIAEGRSSVPHLGNSSPASLHGKNKCPGTHCRLIVKKREDSSCQICSFVGAAETSGVLAEYRGFSGKPKHTGPSEKEGVASE